jgi:hypothetical protein
MVEVRISIFKSCYHGDLDYLNENWELIEPDTLFFDYACLGCQSSVIVFLKEKKLVPKMEHMYIAVRKNSIETVRALGLPFDNECMRIALGEGYWELVNEIEKGGLSPLHPSISVIIYGEQIKQYIKYKIVLEKTKRRAARIIFDRWPRKCQKNLIQDF